MPQRTRNRQYNDDWEWRDLVIDAGTGRLLDSSNYATDAFGRRRVSEPRTLFDSKLLGDNRAIFWSTRATGSGASSAYDANRSSVTLSTTSGQAGAIIRQTYQRFNYQPGKSHLVLTTNVLGEVVDGNTKRFGYFDENNGVFFQQDSGGLYVGVRSNRSGTPTDTVIPSSAWNIDNLDGSDSNSGIALDTSKSNIYFMDFEWLGVGEVRFGVVVGGAPTYIHQQNHANIETGVYMTTPNLPLRYEISNDGTGAAASMEMICNSVISEGGQEVTGVTRSASTAGTHLSASTADTLYALIGLRLKSTHLDAVTEIIKIAVIAETNDDFEWQLLLNPTVAGTFTFSDETNSAIQSAKGATANTVTGGFLMDAGWGKSGSVTQAITNNLRYLGAAVDGTQDKIVLCIRPLANNAVIQGSITWREHA